MANTIIAGPNARTNMEAGVVYIPMWHSGLYTQRSPLFTPLSTMGLQMIQRLDTLWSGLNVELSLANTLVRRPGFAELCTQAFNSSEIASTFYSFKNLSGTVYPIVDTTENVYTFTPSALTNILTKTAGAAQTSFQSVGNTLYMADGEDIQQWTGIGSTFAVGLAIPIKNPIVTPEFSGVEIMAPPTVGISYGYSYGNSNTGQVSTMSPASGATGDLDTSTIVESFIKVNITTAITLNDGTTTGGIASGYHCTFGCVNLFAVGQVVTISGYTGPQTYINNTYTITSCNSSSFTASTNPWGTNVGSGHGPGFANADLTLTNISAVGTMSPITVPGNTTQDPDSQAYTYTVSLSDSHNPASISGAYNSGGSGSATTTVVKANGVTLGVSATANPIGGKFYDDGAGNLQFNSAQTGQALSVTYNITPTGNAAPVSFKITGVSSNAVSQPNITGYSGVDNITVFRTLDGDATAGPWYFLSLIPNNVALTSATVAGTQTTYTFATTVPAGATNGFAGAANTGGATIAGFANAGNNGTFDIVGSTATSITCTNSGGVTETHAATVNASAWTYTDTGQVFGYSYITGQPDGEVDTLIEAPIDDANNPPPSASNPILINGVPASLPVSTFNLLCYNAGRMFGAISNYVYFAAGPDTTYGNGNESFPPANVFVFPGPVTALASVSSGLAVWTETDMFVIYGTSSSSFYPALYQKNYGVANQNCVAQDGDMLFIYTTKSQLYCFSDSLSEIGFTIGNLLLSTFNPSTTYLALHRNGSDAGLFISDGSTNMFRYRLDQQSWSTICQVVGGAGAIASIDLPATFDTTEHYWLLAGRSTGSGHILGRTPGTFLDQGSTYPASVVVGSLLVAPPGKTTIVKSVILERMPVGTDPLVSVLVDEIAGTFVNLPNPVHDPPLTKPSTTIISKKHWIKSNQQQLSEQMRHMQVQISFNSEAFQNEILSLSLV